jgi:hypothetical protein
MPGFDHLFKLGHCVDGEFVQLNHPNVWERREEEGIRPRLVIGPADGHISLILALTQGLDTHFCPLYILKIPNNAAELGRYQGEWMSHEELGEFLTEFRDLFERDGRHELWLGATWDGRVDTMIAYNEHQLIHAYGPLDRFEPILATRGLLQTDYVPIPCPHEHHYRTELACEIEKLMSSRSWRWSPLLEADLD